MQITIDTNNLSELDINMLAFLAGVEATEPDATGDEVSADEPEETPAPAPAKKAPAKKAATKAAPAPEPEEDLLGGEPEPAGDGPTMSDAVAAATKLVSSGESAKVKAALESVGVARVSGLDESQVADFLAALEG